MNKLLALALLGGCFGGGSDGDGGGTGPISMATAQAQCNKQCERDVECDTSGTATQEDCVAKCIDDVYQPGYRSDAVIAITNCFANLECGESDDLCQTMCTPTPTHNAYESTCRAKFDECGGEISGSSPDDVCEVTPIGEDDTGVLCVITPAVIKKLQDCFAEDCDSIKDCFQQVIDDNGIEF